MVKLVEATFSSTLLNNHFLTLPRGGSRGTSGEGTRRWKLIRRPSRREGEVARAVRACAAKLIALLLLLGMALATPLLAAESDPLVRELFVPFEDLDVVLKGGGRRVFLTRAEYDELIEKAGVATETPAPVATSVLSTDYEGTINGPSAIVQGRILIDVTASGVHAVELPLVGVGLLNAELDGKPAAMSQPVQGKSKLFVEGRGRHELKLELRIPVKVAAAQQTLHFRVPRAGSGQFRLRVPGNVDVKSGLAILSRTLADDQTSFQFLLNPGLTTLVLSLSSDQLDTSQILVARTVLIDELTETYERLHVTASMHVPHGAIERFRFAIPQGFDVTDVTTPLLSRWQVVELDGRPVLEVQLREAATSTEVLNISAQRNVPDLENWTMPNLEPLDVAGTVSVVGLLVEEQLQAKSLVEQALIPIDVSALTATLPSSLLEAEPGAPTITAIAAYFSPDSQFQLTASFQRPPAEFDVATNQVLKISDSGLELAAGFTLFPRAERTFEFNLLVDEGWEISHIKWGDQDLEFESNAEADGRTRVRVKLAESVQAGTAVTLRLEATRTPNDWLADWDSRQIDFPTFEIQEATSTRGAIAVQAVDDIVAQDETTSGLLPLDEKEKARHGFGRVATDLAFFFETGPVAATFAAQRVAPRLTAETYSFLRIEPGRLLADFELVFDVADARTRSLAFELPLETPQEIGVEGLNGATVKEFSSTDTETARRWEVSLTAPTRGVIRLRISFEQPLDLEETTDENGGQQLAEALALPVVKAADVQYQTGSVAVEGSAELEIVLTTKARKIDVGELIDASYQPGSRLLGAYGFVGDPAAVSAKVTKPRQYGLPSAIIQRGEIVSAFSGDGLCQSAARFQLRTKAQFVQIQLPKGSLLWSAYLDGAPSKPQRNAERLLISIPRKRGAELRDLQLVYETPTRDLRMWGDLEVSAPRLFLQDEPDAPAMEVPMADLEWYVSLPAGYRLANSSGRVYPDLGNAATREHLAEYRTPLESLAARATRGEFTPASGVIRGSFKSMAAVTDARANLQSRAAGPQAATAVPPPDAMTFQLDELAERWSASSGKDGAVEENRRYYAQPADQPARAGEPPAPGQMQAESAPAPDPFAQPRSGEQPPSAADDLFDAVPVDVDAEIAEGEQRTVELFDEADSLPGLDVAQSQTSGGAPSSTLGTIARQGRGKYWALEGLRSLRIDLATSEEKFLFRSLGQDPVLDITVVDYHQLELVAWGLALLVLAVGLALTKRPFSVKLRYVVFILVFTTLLPLLIGWQREFGRVVDLLFYAGLALVPLYLLFGVGGKLSEFVNHRWFAQAAAAVMCLLMAFATDGFAQQETEAQVGPIRVKLLGPETPVTIPKDVVIVPYDPAKGAEAASTEKVMVPYDKYVELWDLAYPDRKLKLAAPPTEYAWAGANWKTTLTNENSLIINGNVEIDTFVDGLVAVPIALSGGVLEKATMDGKPARIAGDPLSNGSAPNSGAQQATQLQSDLSLKSILLIDGKGRHRLDFAIRYRLTRRGGWRVVDGVLPKTSAAKLSISVPDAKTELRLLSLNDRTEYESTSASETVEAAIADGVVRLQWRPKVAQAAVDRSLTAASDAVFDVQEDSLRLVWRTDFLFPRATRDVFEIGVSDDYSVEQVTGENIRGWKRSDGRVEVSLLNPVRDRQRLTLHLARRGAVGDGELADIEVPVIEVPDAVLHEGRIALRRSPLLDVTATETDGLVRTDLQSVATMKSVTSASPLGIKPYQAYRFGRTPYRLRLSASRVQASVAAETQALMKISENRTSVEARVILTTNKRPLHRVTIQLPAGFESDNISAPGLVYSAITDGEDGVSRLSMQLGSGQLGKFEVILSGKLQRAAGNGSTETLPQFFVEDVQRQETTVVVQTEPSLSARTSELNGCEQVLMERAYAWLDMSQRALARLAIHADSADFSGSILLQQRSPRIRYRTISNLRVTPRAFEETILLDFTIQDAGVREVAFLLPSDLRDARINAPLLRRKTIEDVSADQIRVRLELKDALLGQFRVLVENDRLVTDDERAVPIPIVETGVVDEQFIALESAGRDEVVVARSNEVEPLARQQSQWRTLASVLGDQVTQAYLISSKAQAPQLVIQTKDRQMLETVGARIAFAETLLVVDESGAYRGTQTYQMDNRTEQFLEVVLPKGSKLWTARVANDPVKPIDGNGAVRIPLVKTAEGDQDYPVELKYGGDLEPPARLAKISFPLLKTANINVEESQVRLRLPKALRWFNFDGTMQNVQEEGDLIAGYVQYKKDQLMAAASGLTSQNPFARARSLSNLKKFVGELEELDAQSGRGGAYGANAALEEQLESSRRALEIAKRQLRDEQNTFADVTGGYVGNSGKLNTFFEQQRNDRSARLFSHEMSNFYAGQGLGERPSQQSERDDQTGNLQQEWIENNQLSNESLGKIAEEKKRINIAPKQAQPTPQADRWGGQTGGMGFGGAGGGYGGYGGGAEGYRDYGGYGGYGGGEEFRANQPGGVEDREGYGGGYGGGGQAEAFGDDYTGTADSKNGAAPARGSTLDRVQKFQQKLGQQSQQMQAQSAKEMPRRYRNDLGRSSGRPELAAKPNARTPSVPAFSADGRQVLTGSADGEQALGLPPVRMGIPVRATGLASLDVALPVRGVEYMFKTPRGDIQITARSIERNLISRLNRLATVLTALVVIGLAYRLLCQIGFDRVFGRLTCVLFFAVGIFSLFYIAPLVPLILIAFSVVQFVRLSVKRRPKPIEAAA